MSSTQAQRDAYAQGVWDAQCGAAQASPYSLAELTKHWKDGVRDVRTDARLDADTSWDEETGS